MSVCRYVPMCYSDPTNPVPVIDANGDFVCSCGGGSEMNVDSECECPSGTEWINLSCEPVVEECPPEYPELLFNKCW